MTKVTIIEIPKPSNEEMESYLKKWLTEPHYVHQESSLTKLFKDTYPLNNCLDDVLIKVCSLNDFYSTNIYSPYKVAKHIIDLKIDEELKKGSLTIVNQIAEVKVTNHKSINFYSFATKYCSHHRPKVYPIYDSYVEKMLMYFKQTHKFERFKKEDLKTYTRYKDILEKFRDFYELNNYDLKQIDKYLWQAGKTYFKRDFSKKENDGTI